MEHFNKELHDNLLNCVPLADHKQFIKGYNKIVDELNQSQEKYKDRLPHLDMESTIHFDCNQGKLNYRIHLDNDVSDTDKPVLIKELSTIISHYFNPDIYRYL